MSEKTIKAAMGKAMSIDREKNTLTAMITTNNVDRDGDVIEPTGIDFSNYQKNPVVLWAHDPSQMPIAKIEKLYMNPQGVLADIKFAEHSFAKDVFNLYAEGFLNAWSIGFTWQKEGVEPRMDEEGRVEGYHFTKTELLELSAVPIPANPEALTRSFDGVCKDSLVAFSKSLETMPEKFKSDAEEFVTAVQEIDMASNTTEEEITVIDMTVEDAPEVVEAADVVEEELPVVDVDEVVEKTEDELEQKEETKKTFYAVYQNGVCEVYKEEGSDAEEIVIRESAYNKSFSERGTKGDVPVSVEFGENAHTKITFEVIQEKEGEVVEAKVLHVSVVLPVSKEAEVTPEVKSEGRNESPVETPITEDNEADVESQEDAQEERETEATEEESEADKSLDALTVKLKQKQLMLRARFFELSN